jgi:hypothetical protein
MATRSTTSASSTATTPLSLSTRDAARPTGRYGPTQILALVTALALLGVGIAGFFVTEMGDGFAHHDTGDELLGFELNPLHNVVHLALGALGLGLWSRLRSAIAYGVVLAVGYSAVVVYGMFALNEDWDFLSLNRPDNWLHVSLAALGVLIVAVGYWQARREGRLVTYEDGEEIIDLTADGDVVIEDRLRGVIPDDMQEPAGTHRSTGLPTARRG